MSGCRCDYPSSITTPSRKELSRNLRLWPIFRERDNFFNPRQVISRQAGLSVFAVVTGITNEQQYDFVSFADSTSMVMLVLLILVIVTYFPIWIHPRKVFVQLLARFFRSAEYLLSTMRWDPDGTPTRVDLWRKRFHTRELATLPGKLGTWVHTIDPGILGHTPPQQVQTLVNHLQALSYRMQALGVCQRSCPIFSRDFLFRRAFRFQVSWRVQPDLADWRPVPRVT